MNLPGARALNQLEYLGADFVRVSLDVCFPDPQNRVAALPQIRGLSRVLSYVHALNLVQRSVSAVWSLAQIFDLLVVGWIAMPVIAIELNHNIGFRQERIDHKLLKEFLLSCVRNADTFENRITGHL